MVKAIEWTDGKVVILDQSKLPLEVTFVDCTDYHMVADCIRTLKIRGAPAIGIAAAMGIIHRRSGDKGRKFQGIYESH